MRTHTHTHTHTHMHTHTYIYYAYIYTHIYIRIHADAYVYMQHTEFTQWKSALEESQKSFYCKSTGSKERHDDRNKVSYYNCNRSGMYLAKGTGKRRLKSQGSSKMGAHCTSTIKLIENSDTGLYQVNFCKTHYGHETQLGHIRISNEDKRTIASKRKMGIEKERILKDIREDIGKGMYIL